MKRFISLTLAFLMLFSFSLPITSYGADTTIEITEKQMKSNAYKYIKKALDTAKENATSKKPYTVILPSGTYKLSDCLHIYSNTKLILQDDTILLKTFEENNMIKLGVNKEVNKGYDGYKNVTISGGIWDCNFSGDSCIMRFAHCKNITLENATLRNQKDAHHMELAAADNFIIKKCSFEEFKKTKGGDGEAIQIDPIHSTYHFPGYYEYDDTPCKNVKVDGCTFKNVYAGVGTRSGVIGSYFENIRITNNTFTNIKDKAICAFNYRNSVISNNNIDKCTLGIIFEYYPASNLLGKLYNANYNASSAKLIKSSNCEIKNNTVTVSNRTSRTNSAGIAVYGGYISKKNSSSTGLKAGKYYVENLKVKNNSVTVNSASSYGIILQYVNNSAIASNKVKTASKSKAYGVSLYKSNLNEFKSNTVSGFHDGFALTDKSRNNTFKSNKITSNRGFAITIDKKSSASIQWGNTVKGNKHKYEINSKKYGLYAKGVKLKVKKGKKVNRLNWSAAKGSGYKIYRSTSKKGTYKLIKTVKGRKKTSFTDKHKKGKKYYYKVQPYKSVRKTVIYGKPSNIK